MLSIHELPSKILSRIFGLLDLNDLVAVARVSRKFKNAAHDEALYRSVTFNRRHRLDDVVAILRRQRQAIVACRMDGIADSNTILRYVADCPNLRKLKLVECDGERGIKESIFEKLFAGTDIRDFALKNCELEKFPRLSMRNATSLLIVDNTSYQHPLDYVAELIPAIERNTGTIQSLKLCVDNVSAQDKNRLFDKIAGCTKLRTLQFQYPHVDEIAEDNFKKLFQLREMVSLSVVVSPQTSEAVQRQFFERPAAANLRKIELGGDICRLLPLIVKKCPRLEVLRLTCLSGPFVQMGNEELVNMLSSSRQLKDVSLKSVAVNNLRHAILQLPTYLPHLEHIEIEAEGADESDDNSATPLKIEFNLLPNFALETQSFEGSTVYVLFRSEELLKFITTGQMF